MKGILVKRGEIIFKGIAILLVAAMLLGLIFLGSNIEQKMPEVLVENVVEIIPEAVQTVLEQVPSEDENMSEETPPEEEETPPEEEEMPPEEEEMPPEEEETPPEEEETPPEEEEMPPEEEETSSSEGNAPSSGNESSSDETDQPGDTSPSETLPGESDSETEEDMPGDDPQPDDKPGGNGDTSDDGNGEEVPTEGPEDDSELRIVTDLSNGEITYNELVNDVLNFYAYLINGDGMTLRVKVRNSATPQNGSYLNGDGKNYQTVLCRNETNFFTLYIKEGNTTVQEVTYAVRYVAQKADENNPTVGENPPSIVTNLQGVEQLSNRNFTLTVQATAYTGKNLYSSNIEVRLDGNRITRPTGGPVYEYQLYFEDPDSGDVVNHTVTVSAWDEEGNSAFISYNFNYHFVDTGDEIGTAYIILDATTVGLGVLEEPYTYRIKQNVPASYAIVEMLTEYGYEFDYAGTLDVGFYLRRIQRGGLMDYSEIPENLWQKVLQDELTLTGQVDSDSLGEFDYTQGSGWMYSVGGNVYAGKGLSNYFLSNGDTLYLRFTLAYGKDIGGYSSTGGEFGVLSTYCGKWINDTYVDQHQWGEQTVIREATCTEAGEISCVCSVCNDKRDTVEIPALGHNFVEISRTEPAQGNDGLVIYQCEHCKEEKKENIPWNDEMEPVEPEKPEESETTEPESTESTEPEEPESTKPEETESTEPEEPESTEAADEG